jgi:hypothetical protein
LNFASICSAPLNSLYKEAVDIPWVGSTWYLFHLYLNMGGAEKHKLTKNPKCCTDTPAEMFYVPSHCHVTYFTHNPEIMKQNNDARRSSQPTSPLREIIISRPRKSPLAGPPRFLHTTMFCYIPPHAPPHEKLHLRIPSIKRKLTPQRKELVHEFNSVLIQNIQAGDKIFQKFLQICFASHLI